MQTESLWHISVQKYSVNKKAEIYLEIKWSLAWVGVVVVKSVQDGHKKTFVEFGTSKQQDCGGFKGPWV